MFSRAEAYEHNMGRWSQRLAPLFIEFVGVRDADRVIDVGCGTGLLSLALAGVTRRSEIVGDDPSVSFVDYARSRATDPRLRLEVDNALKIPFPEPVLGEQPKRARWMARAKDFYHRGGARHGAEGVEFASAMIEAQIRGSSAIFC